MKSRKKMQHNVLVAEVYLYTVLIWAGEFFLLFLLIHESYTTLTNMILKGFWEMLCLIHPFFFPPLVSEDI